MTKNYYRLNGCCKCNRSKSHCHKDVKYVQGGLCEPGDGSKCNPWNSLALAEVDHSWKTLIVLPSPVALDGGISLRPGTKLEGAKSPVHGALLPDQPTITNSSAASNGGNGVYVLGGDVKIKNIHFRDTFAAGINYDNARDIKINNVLVTGANQGEFVGEFGPNAGLEPSYDNTKYFIGGLNANSITPGKTFLCNVVVKDIPTGNGVTENIKNGTNRTFVAIKFEYTGGNKLEEFPFSITPLVTGILLTQNGPRTTQNIKITKSNIHDFNSVMAPSLRHMGILLYPTNGAKITPVIENTNFYNIARVGLVSFGVYILVNTPPEEELNFPNSEANISIKNCYYESLENGSQTSFFIGGYNSVTDLLLKDNSIINNYGDGMKTYITKSINNSVVVGNYVEARDLCLAFVTWGPIQYSSIPSLNSVTQTVEVRNNTFKGSDRFSTVPIYSGLRDGTSWKQFTMNMENNCLIGPSRFAGLDVVELRGDGFSELTSIINVNNNNFIGYGEIIPGFFNDDIYNDTEVNINAQGNYFDGTPQVFNEGTGSIDISNPLLTPIVCPKQQYCLQNAQSQNVSQAISNKLEINSELSREEYRKEKIIEIFQ